MNVIKMNTFLQRMLKKSSNEELNVDTPVAEGQKLEAARSGSAKGNWIKKLGSYSPSKYQVPGRSSAVRALDRSDLDNYETPEKPSKSPPLEMPDLESIIREFEMGFLSPSKHDGPHDTSKQKNFVKKIVAAFEVKYKTFDDLKAAQDSHDESRLDPTVVLEPKRRSGIFSSPFRSGSEDFKRLGLLEDTPSAKKNGNRRSGVYFAPSTDHSVDSKDSRRSGVFVTPCKASSTEETSLENSSQTPSETNRSAGVFVTPSKDNLDNSNVSRRSGLFLQLSSPFTCNESDSSKKSDIYMSPVHLDSKNSSVDSSNSKCTGEDSSRFHFPVSPLKKPSLDDTKTMEDLDDTLPEPDETILLERNAIQKTSTMINEFPTVNSQQQVVSSLDKTPKIVGAFLKKPIEVEDTSIDWIPITGKKLPRKRSLKKLLSSLTGKKSFAKKNKLFSSERNLSEEPRELQDSGYDERSSSSSLTSLVSITEVLLHQENSYVGPEKRTALRTFRSRNYMDEEEDEAFCDAYSTPSKQRRGKLLLTEMPREDVKLDLGPSYPSSSKIVTMSLDRKAISKKPQKIPKHPFVAMTKMDESHELPGSLESSVIVKNDLYEVEFRRSCDDICSSLSCRSFSSEDSNYDVPRRFLSKSETEIPAMFRSSVNGGSKEPIYDVPKTQKVERTRSSVYEDALSLKRRAPDFYAFPRDTEPHYATVKPRNNTRVNPNRDVLQSVQDLTSMERISAF